MTTFAQQGPTAGEVSPGTPVSAGSLLLIEDNPIDALRTMALLRTRVPDMACRHVSTLADATPELLAAADCVLLDLSLPDAQNQEGLKEVLHRATDVPVVVLTGLDDPLQTGLESLRNGAQDYLTKNSLDAAGLERSIRYAIERKGFQIDLAAAAALSAATALVARAEARSTAAVTSSAEIQVQEAAAAAAEAAAVAKNAVELAVATAAAAAAVTSAVVDDLLSEARTDWRTPEAADAAAATGDATLDQTGRGRTGRSIGVRVRVLTAKLAVAVAIILTLILVLTTTSAS